MLHITFSTLRVTYHFRVRAIYGGISNDRDAKNGLGLTYQLSNSHDVADSGLRQRGSGRLGLLGLLGFSAVFFRRPKATILMDERDTLIQLRAWTVACSLFWIVLVATAVFGAAVLYGQDGSIPGWIVQVGVAVAFMLVLSIASIALLIQYSTEVRHGS